MERALPAVLERCSAVAAAAMATASPAEKEEKEPLDQELLRATGEGVPVDKPNATVMFHLLRTPSNPFVNPRRGIRPATQAGQPGEQESDRSQQLPPSDGAVRGRADVTAQPVVPSIANPFAGAAAGGRESGRTPSQTGGEAQTVSAPVEQPVPSTSGTQRDRSRSRPDPQSAGPSGPSQVVQPKTRVRAVDHASLNNLARPTTENPTSSDSALQVAAHFDCPTSPTRQQLQANLLQRVQLRAQQLRHQQVLQQQLMMRRQHLTPQQLMALRMQEQQQLMMQQQMNIRQYQAQQQMWGSMQMRNVQQLAQQQLMAQRQQLLRTPPQTAFQPLQTQPRLPQAMYQGASTRTNECMVTPTSQIPSRQLPPHSAPLTSFPNLTPVPARTMSVPSFLDCPSTYSTFPPRPGPSNMPLRESSLSSQALSSSAATSRCGTQEASCRSSSHSQALDGTASLRSGIQETSCQNSCHSFTSPQISQRSQSEIVQKDLERTGSDRSTRGKGKTDDTVKSPQISQRSLSDIVQKDLERTGSERSTGGKGKTGDTRSESQLSDPNVTTVKRDISLEETEKITSMGSLPIKQANGTGQRLEDSESVPQGNLHRKVTIAPLESNGSNEAPTKTFLQQQSRSSTLGALDTKEEASPETGVKGVPGKVVPEVSTESAITVQTETGGSLEPGTVKKRSCRKASAEGTIEAPEPQDEQEADVEKKSEEEISDAFSEKQMDDDSEQSQSELSLPTGERAELGVFTKDEISSDIATHEANSAKVVEKKESKHDKSLTEELSTDISTAIPEKDTGDIQEEEIESASPPKEKSPLETTSPEPKQMTKDVPKKEPQSTASVEEKISTVTTSTKPEKVSETIKIEPPELTVVEEKGAAIDASVTVKESLTVDGTAKAGGGETVEDGTVKKGATVEKKTTSDESATVDEGDTVEEEPVVVSKEPSPKEEKPPGVPPQTPGAVAIPPKEAPKEEAATPIISSEKSSTAQSMELVLTIPLGELDIGTAPFQSTELVGGVSGTLTVDVTSGTLKSSEMHAKLLTRPQVNAEIQTSIAPFPLGINTFPFGPIHFAVGADAGVSGCKPGATCQPAGAAAAAPPAATAATVLGYAPTAAVPTPRPCGCPSPKPEDKEKKKKKKETGKSQPRTRTATRSCPRAINTDKVGSSNPPCCRASPITPSKWRSASVTVRATSGSTLSAVLRHASPARKATPTGASGGRPSRPRNRSES